MENVRTSDQESPSVYHRDRVYKRPADDEDRHGDSKRPRPEDDFTVRMHEYSHSKSPTRDPRLKSRQKLAPSLVASSSRRDGDLPSPATTAFTRPESKQELRPEQSPSLENPTGSLFTSSPRSRSPNDSPSEDKVNNLGKPRSQLLSSLFPHKFLIPVTSSPRSFSHNTF